MKRVLRKIFFQVYSEVVIDCNSDWQFMNSLRILINPIIFIVNYQFCLRLLWARHTLMQTLGIHCRGVLHQINCWPPWKKFRLRHIVLWVFLKHKVSVNLVFNTWLAHNCVGIGHITLYWVLENCAFHLGFAPHEGGIFERRLRLLYWIVWSKFKAKRNFRAFTMCVNWRWFFRICKKTWNVLLRLLTLLQFLDAVEGQVLVVGQTIVNERFRAISGEVPLKSGI